MQAALYTTLFFFFAVPFLPLFLFAILHVFSHFIDAEKKKHTKPTSAGPALHKKLTGEKRIKSKEETGHRLHVFEPPSSPLHYLTLTHS